MGDCYCARTSTTGDDGADDEQTHETKKGEIIGKALKKLRNIKHREMNTFILKDLLSSEGVIIVRGLKSKHLKELK